MNDPNRPEDKSRGAQSSETASAGSSGAGSGGASSPGQAAGAAADAGEGQRSAATAGSAAGSATTAGEAGQASSSPQDAAASSSSSASSTTASAGSGDNSSSSSSGEAAQEGTDSSSASSGQEDGGGSGGSGDGGAPRPPEPRSRFTLWFAILLLAGGTGGVGWLTYNMQQDLRQARQQFERLDEINAEVEQALGRVEEQAEAAQAQDYGEELQALRSRLGEVASRSESTVSTVASLEEQLGASPDGQRLSELQSRLESTAEAVSALQERVATLAEQQGGGGVGEEQLQGLREQLSGQIDELAASQEQIRSRLEKLGARDPAEEQSWVKAEAGYLAQIAIDRVRHHHDVDSALAALRDADELLAQLGGQGIEERKAVGQAIDALLDYSGPETGEIRQRIVAQIEGIDQLSLGARPDAEDAPQLPELQAEGESDSGWQKAANRVWERLQKGLGDLVRIQREGDAAQFLPPEQRYFLRENLRLQLEGVLLALSSGNPEAYRSGLERAAAWVQDHFDSEDPAVAKAVEELNALAEEPITHDPPEIAPTLEPVKPF